MKKLMISFIICISFASIGCVSLDAKRIESSPNPSYPAGSLLNADTINLAEAFIENQELRSFFIQAAKGSLPLADSEKASQYYFDYENNGTGAYYGYDNGRIFTDDSLYVDDDTAYAIRKIEELLPGASIWMRMIDDRRMCVFFSIAKNTTGKDGEYYQEDLIYTLYDLTDMDIYGYDNIEENWYYFVANLE